MISVCIPTIRPTTIEHAVRSIRQQTYCDWELVVVGQGDEVVLRAAVESASASDQRIRYIHSERRGLSIARNLGIRATTGEIVAFMDDDCEAAPDWLAQILFHSGPDIGLVGGSLVAPAKRKRAIGHCPHLASANATYDPMSTSTGELPGFGALGANIAVRRVAAEQVGGFDELLGAGAHFPGGEEHDYSYRIFQAGFRLRSSSEIIMNHTYGYRYGVRSILKLRRDRFRGDGALVAKARLVDAPADGVSIRSALIESTMFQFKTLTPKRLPNGLFRMVFFLAAYREVLKKYVVANREAGQRFQAVLSPRSDSEPSGRTGRPVVLP